MKTDQPLFLNEEQVREHLRMTELIPAMEKALIDFSAGRVTQPVRSIISIDPPGGFFGLMPALTPDGLGLKAVMWKRCGSLGNLRKFVCGAPRLNTQSGLHRKLAPQRCLLKKPCATPM
jgi:ornithine cyclodeaminase/alanine dehydrogenase-like protein (mu-crystallin family)